ncbi:MAG TPA: GNAT family N-acetyltransferase, partial [Steroidobacteraceae bacterium]
WATYYRDCEPLWPEHYTEIAVDKDRMPMRPDVATYQALDAAGRLQIVVARDDGRMVGYVLSVIRPHLHYADVLCGYEDAYFLTQSRRRGMVGVKLLREAVRYMQSVGVQKAFFMTKVSLNMGPIFERMGFTMTDVVYSKWIGSD